MNAFNAIMRELLDGRNQVLLEVRMIQLAHTSIATPESSRQKHVRPSTSMPRTIHSERQPEPGAADYLLWFGRPGDTLAILGILLASGQVSSPCFQTGLPFLAAG